LTKWPSSCPRRGGCAGWSEGGCGGPPPCSSHPWRGALALSGGGPLPALRPPSGGLWRCPEGSLPPTRGGEGWNILRLDGSLRSVLWAAVRRLLPTQPPRRPPTPTLPHPRARRASRQTERCPTPLPLAGEGQRQSHAQRAWRGAGRGPPPRQELRCGAELAHKGGGAGPRCGRRADRDRGVGLGRLKSGSRVSLGVGACGRVGVAAGGVPQLL
jgi:hypothetical protein